MSKVLNIVSLVVLFSCLCFENVLSYGGGGGGFDGHGFGGGYQHHGGGYHGHGGGYHGHHHGGYHGYHDHHSGPYHYHHNHHHGDFSSSGGSEEYPSNIGSNSGEGGDAVEGNRIVPNLTTGTSTGNQFVQQNATAIEGDNANNFVQSVQSCRIVNNRIVGQWLCANGDLIDCGGLCNGRRNCADGSDETVLSCRNIFCLDSTFRCAYGGCIRGEQECDGVNDCADGSDEKTINCPGILSTIRPSGNCSEGYFQCKNGECIFDDGVCSGGAECKDGSDETAEVCSTHFCPEPGFRCDYGACILRMGRCDGKRDCVDGSDEKEELCRSLNAIGGSFTPNTGGGSLALTPPNSQPRPVVGFLGPAPGMETLPTGTGRPTSSDTQSNRPASNPTRVPIRRPIGNAVTPETVESIEDLFSTVFGENNTSGVSNPTQPSMQQLITDNFPIIPDSTLPPIIRTPESTPETPVVGRPVNNPSIPQSSSPTSPPVILPVSSSPAPPISNAPREEGDCDAPVVQNGRVSDVFSRRYDNRFIKNGEEVIFQCLIGSSLIGVNSTFCINGKFLQDPPICTNMCSGLPLNTLSVQGECFEPTGVKIPCSPLLPPKTIAILSCKIGYKRPDRTVPDAYTCMDDGNWNAHVYKCIPICGEVTEGRRLIVGGEESNITKVPWHAGIYENINSGNMQQICGGSIINPTAIVTAAHCFWDQQRGQLKDAKLFQVAVGKTLRDFNADEPTAQRFQVASIKIYEQYMDFEGLFVSDIAVTVLEKPIIFQSYIKPICVEYSLKGNQRYVVSGIQGRVAGWGLTASQGSPSPILKTLDLPTVDYNTCLNESPPSFKSFITTDKFCGGFTSGESVCRGDSGGGYAIAKPSPDDNTKMIYFLRGIVSVGPILQGSCDNTKYSAFTDIQLHNIFLYEYLFI